MPGLFEIRIQNLEANRRFFSRLPGVTRAAIEREVTGLSRKSVGALERRAPRGHHRIPYQGSTKASLFRHKENRANPPLAESFFATEAGLGTLTGVGGVGSGRTINSQIFSSAPYFKFAAEGRRAISGKTSPMMRGVMWKGGEPGVFISRKVKAYDPGDWFDRALDAAEGYSDTAIRHLGDRIEGAWAGRLSGAFGGGLIGGRSSRLFGAA